MMAGRCSPPAHIVRVLEEHLLALGGLGAAARGVGAGAAVGLDVCASSLVLLIDVVSDVPHGDVRAVDTYRHVELCCAASCSR